MEMNLVRGENVLVDGEEPGGVAGDGGVEQFIVDVFHGG